MMRPAERFETSRLRLRQPRIEDAEDIFREYAQDPEVTRFLPWRPHRDIEDTREFLRRCRTVWTDGTAFPWVILRKRDDRLMGMLEVEFDDHRALVGYVLARRYWGEGYMTEAVSAVIERLLAQRGVHRVWAHCDVDNRASAKVLEKCGMRLEGTLRKWNVHPNISDLPRDCLCYSMVVEDEPGRRVGD